MLVRTLQIGFDRLHQIFEGLPLDDCVHHQPLGRIALVFEEEQAVAHRRLAGVFPDTAPSLGEGGEQLGELSF